MTWKDKVENNITLFVLGLLATGFASGFGAYKLLLDGGWEYANTMAT